MNHRAPEKSKVHLMEWDLSHLSGNLWFNQASGPKTVENLLFIYVRRILRILVLNFQY